MWTRYIILILVVATLLNNVVATSHRTVSRYPVLWDGTTYDYDYGQYENAPSRERATPKQTSQRPIVQYFNKFIKNIRLPITSWNLRNPLTKIFNPNTAAETINVHEKPKRKKSKKTNKTGSPTQQTIFLQPYPDGIDPDKAKYFYDVVTGQFYEMQYTEVMDDDQQPHTEFNENEDDDHQREEEDEKIPHKTGLGFTLANASPTDYDDDSVSVVEQLDNDDDDNIEDYPEYTSDGDDEESRTLSKNVDKQIEDKIRNRQFHSRPAAKRSAQVLVNRTLAEM